MTDKAKLEKVAKEADLVTEHKKLDTGRPAGSKGALPAIKTMVKADLMREVGTSRKKLKELENKLIEFTKAGEPAKDQIPPEMWGVFPSLVYGYMATHFGPQWKLKEDEVLLYGQNLQKVADRYLGAVAGDNPELISLAIVAVSVTVPRIMLTIALSNVSKEIKEKGLEDAVSRKEKNGDNNGLGAKGIGKKQLDPKSAS